MTYALGKHCSIQLSYEGRVEIPISLADRMNYAEWEGCFMRTGCKTEL